MTDDDKCPRCSTEVQCMGGRSAHWSNWYCPKPECGWQACDNKTDAERANKEPHPSPEQVRDAERLDFVLNNSAFTMVSLADAGGNTIQLWTQNEDEEYVVLHNPDSFFRTAREAIDAAIRKQKGE
jgi:hypothetical protein